jgi:hypothetical protein
MKPEAEQVQPQPTGEFGGGASQIAAKPASEVVATFDAKRLQTARVVDDPARWLSTLDS